MRKDPGYLARMHMDVLDARAMLQSTRDPWIGRALARRISRCASNPRAIIP
jgi:murein L,D-transpeptidase YcbB/YkuD